MKKYLVLSAIGSDRPGLIRDIAKAIADVGCSVADCRMTVLGSEFIMILLASGNWNAVAKRYSERKALTYSACFHSPRQRLNRAAAHPSPHSTMTSSRIARLESQGRKRTLSRVTIASTQ